MKYESLKKGERLSFYHRLMAVKMLAQIPGLHKLKRAICELSKTKLN